MPSDTTPKITTGQPSLSVYYNASRVRTDTWSELKNASRRLREWSLSGRDVSKLRDEITSILDTLEPIESYWAFPGRVAFESLRRQLAADELDGLSRSCALIARLLAGGTYRGEAAPRAGGLSLEQESQLEQSIPEQGLRDTRPYFEVLVVDEMSEIEEAELRQQLARLRRQEDEFIYEIVVVPSFEDALIAVLLNYNLQACVIRYGFPFRSTAELGFLSRTMDSLYKDHLELESDSDIGIALCDAIRNLRPTLDQYLVTDAPVEDIAGRVTRRFRRIFYRQEDYQELHLSLLKGVHQRFHTPFFGALKSYSQKPTGVFHALPISRSKSIIKSHWIGDMGTFYGKNIFLAETSATTGGLDSLLQPHGPIREAQELAARAFGAQRSYFVTNGTSTANKIVMQAVVRPDDLVLVSRDCHKSHHYSHVLLGAEPVYLDSYPLEEYSMYGAVPLSEIKRHLLALKRAGRLHRVRMVLLTNCTFDGVVYNPERVMMEILAIKPDMIFLWDEAWYAFAYFTPISRRRTGMDSAKRIRARLRSPKYAEEFQAWKKEFDAKDQSDDATWMDGPLLPDPERARVRVYSTQSTHKTLTSLRQGSMIHVFDQDFSEAQEAFDEAYMTHTSTSPNYQILASLDVGRRQVELEGYEMVQHAIELGLTLREHINSSSVLARYFHVLSPAELIPSDYRKSGFETYRDVFTDWAQMDRAWEEDEFVLDPTRITLYIGATGLDGDKFKQRLIDDHDIQINKTSRNTVLFMTHIGSTRSSVAYLLEVLTQIAEDLDDAREVEGANERRNREDAVRLLTTDLPPLPDFSAFHDAFRANPEGTTREGDLRTAFFSSSDEANVEYLKLDGTVERALNSDRDVVAASFVIPYPPGFPILVPGQVVSSEILAFLTAVDVKEIHGYHPEFGLRVFTEAAIAAFSTTT